MSGGLTWHKSTVPHLRHFLPFLEGHHVLVRPDNTTVVAYLNKEGGLRSTRLNTIAYRLIIWSYAQSQCLGVDALCTAICISSNRVHISDSGKGLRGEPISYLDSPAEDKKVLVGGHSTAPVQSVSPSTSPQRSADTDVLGSISPLPRETGSLGLARER